MGRRGHGEGSIYRRADGRWVATISLGGGKRKSFTGTTRKAVAERLTAALRDRDRGLPIVAERQTVAQYLADWIAAANPTLKPLSQVSYAQDIRLHLAPALGAQKLARLSAQAVQRFLADKLTAGAAPASVRHMYNVLHRALADAERLGLVARNVCDLVQVPRVTRAEIHPLTGEQLRALLAACRGHRLEALYTLALATGMRRGELCALRWADVDLDAGAIHVRRTVAWIDGRWVYGEPKSAKGRRRILLAAPAVEALRAHRARQLAERLALGPAWAEGDLVFASEVGTPLSKTTVVYRGLRPLLTRAGLPLIRFHDLRHTCATLLLGARVNPKVVSELLGHSSVAITLDVYAHVLPDMQQDAAEVMGSFMAAVAVGDG